MRSRILPSAYGTFHQILAPVIVLGASVSQCVLAIKQSDGHIQMHPLTSSAASVLYFQSCNTQTAPLYTQFPFQKRNWSRSLQRSCKPGAGQSSKASAVAIKDGDQEAAKLWPKNQTRHTRISRNPAGG